MQIQNYFDRGLNNTVLMKNGSQFSYAGPWVYLIGGTTTRLDRWFIGSFMSVEYSIVADYDPNNREFIKCIVVAGPSKADLTIFGKADLGQSLVTLSATVNNSYVDINVTPSADDSTALTGTKVYFQATYFQSINPIRG